jgi:hypothetical protein
MTLAAPFNGSPAELTKTAFRFQSVAWTSGGSIWLTENDRDSRKVRTRVMDAPGAAPRKLFERSTEDSYNNPGTPSARFAARAPSRVPERRQRVHDRRRIVAEGRSSVPRSLQSRPARRSASSRRKIKPTNRCWRCLSDDGSRFITRFGTRTSPPQIAMRGREANCAGR